MSPFSGNAARAVWMLCIFVYVSSSRTFAAEFDYAVSDDAGIDRKNTCAMSQVLQAMNDLLTVLSSEIRDLKKTVHTKCKGKEGPSQLTRPEPGRKPQGGKAPKEETEEDKIDEDDIFESFGKDDDETTDDYNDDYDDGSKTPADNLVEGISNWWNSIVPFPKPTDAPTTAPPEPPLPPYGGGDPHGGSDPYVIHGDDDGNPGGDDDHLDGDDPPGGDDRYDPYRRDYTSSSSTTEPPVSYDAPPEPTSCPSPFRLQASGCFLVFHDQRDWKSWGEAHAFCQNYEGSLAAPWRLPKLQAFLTRHYSDAFWVGANFDAQSSTWKWLSGRDVETSAWRQGQPNRNPGMKCVYLDKWSGYHANNFFCGEKYPFICEISETVN